MLSACAAEKCTTTDGTLGIDRLHSENKNTVNLAVCFILRLEIEILESPVAMDRRL